jgi:DNA-binding transcriptional regulator GbsR (MarR family)
LLYLSAQPLSLDDIVQMLGVSKASASTATRQLSAWGLIRQVWVPGERRDYFEVVEDLGGLIRGGYRDFIKPRLESSQRLFDSILSVLEEDAVAGAVSREEFRICAERLRKLCRMQKKLQAAAPLLERLL